MGVYSRRSRMSRKERNHLRMQDEEYQMMGSVGPNPESLKLGKPTISLTPNEDYMIMTSG